MELLAPLTVLHVGLTAADVPCLTTIEKERLDTSVLKHLVDRHPVNTRGFHRHRIHSARSEPCGHLPQLRRGAPKSPHRWGASTLGHRHIVLSRADVHACGVR